MSIATPPVSFNKVSSTCLKTLKVLQINLGRTKAANDTLHPTSDKLQSDLLLLQEPYIYDSQIKGIPQSWSIFNSISNKAAVIIPSRQLHVALISCKQNTVAVKIQTGQQPTTFISAYSSPYSNIQETLLEIQEIISSLPREKIFIGADLNGHNTLWGYSDVNSSGTAIEEFILANNLFINNSSDAPPTFTRNSSKGWPDLSLCTQQMIGEIANWEVLEEPSLSDHHYIEITIDSSVKNCTFTRYKTRHGNHNIFLKNLKPYVNSLLRAFRNSQNEKDINEATNLLQNCVIEACNKSYRTKNQNLSPTPNWYTQDLEIEKNRLKALRRRAQRAPQDQRNARFQFHKEELKKKAIKPAELIALNNQDPSGNHLKIAQDILEKIFPHPANSNSSTYIPPCTANDCPFTKGEVATVIHHLSKGKAPGPDGIDNIIIQQIFKKFPFLLMELFNTCLKLAKFPDPLKVGNIILFHKHGKSKTEASSYRPISLLPTIGKVLEKLLTQRLNFHLEKNNRLSNLQYGFREGRSTEMAITKLLDTIRKGKANGDHVLVLSIDIKGAFDNIQHSAIASYLDNSKCPANIVNIFKNLLQNRKVILNTCEGPAIRDQKQGCPQGSCSGPALWNLVANEILQENWPINTSIQAFADDFVLVSHAPTRVQLESQINESIAKFSTWTSKNQLQISAEKTNYLLISKLVRGPTIRWQGERIKRAHAIKYLGIYIDEKMNWNTHLKAQSTRATQLYHNLLKIAGKSWGVPLIHRRTLYKTVTERVLAHGAVAWCLEPTVRIARKLSTIQRPFLLAISGAYRITSTAALQVILGIPPLHLQLQREARGTALFRLRLPLSTNISDIDPSEIEEKATGWSTHPSEHLSPTQISLDDGGNINTGLRIYTDGSKTERGVGAAFCVLTDVNITHRWSTRLSLRNTVFQAEILALLKAVEHAVSLPTQQLTILVDNQASINSAANPKSHNSIARKIFKLLHSHPHIRVSWIKAHAGYIGNEEADRLAKEAAETENFPETPLELTKSFIKTFLRQKMLATWQMAWDDGDTGRLIHNIIPKVSLHPINWTRNEVLFFTGHGPFPSFLHRFNLAETSFCSCGEIGTPIHYATVCLLTTSYHMAPPNQQHQPIWFRRVANNSTSRRKIHNLLHFLQRETSLFRPDPN
ncbi:Putative protein in type-1 retrotransposable element R1DM [Araneus ventricosus]|uniref:Retrovirus-related Pol polyprotein from type-1 retrotransposable element R1 n=1 Tax=Araneus ventricosus TaxID=182803 RepID=A0A4Y2JL06_ARAVE|nr:Putative protein in type-1 retrotransposable element R1DM [Araneus ventricosus]